MCHGRSHKFPRLNIKSARRGSLLGILVVGILVAGCASMIAPKIIAPQRGGLQGVLEGSPDGQFMLQNIDAYISVRRRIAVGPPRADLAVAVVPPGRYSLRFGEEQGSCSVLYLTGSAETRLVESMGHLWLSEHQITEAEARKRHLAISITPAPAGSAILRRYRASIASLRSTSQPRGTIILLPGYGVGKLSMLPWALLLGRAGYQSILVDLRAQGQSTGEYVTYGALESRDLVQLVAELRKAGLIRGPLGMLGNSMGAATALLAAPQIPEIAAIVAISPYGRATTVLPRYARLTAWYADLIPSGSWKAAERKADQLAGVSLAEAAPIKAAPEIRAPVLYIQGGRDQIINAKEAHELAAHTTGSDLLIYPKLGHLQMTEDYTGLAQPVIDWYNRYLAKDMEQAPPPETGPRPPNAIALSLCGARF